MGPSKHIRPKLTSEEKAAHSAKFAALIEVLTNACNEYIVQAQEISARFNKLVS
jgi:hypothetical protein